MNNKSNVEYSIIFRITTKLVRRLMKVDYVQKLLRNLHCGYDICFGFRIHSYVGLGHVIKSVCVQNTKYARAVLLANVHRTFLVLTNIIYIGSAQ